MSSEETPLLQSDGINAELSRITKREDVYSRFSPARKVAILIIISGCGLLPFFVMGTFTPSIPEIAKDLNTTGTIVNLAVSLSVLAASVGGLTGASYSTFYGRRLAYLCFLPVLIIASFAVSTARSVPSLLIWRFFQSLGCSPGMVIGAGVIGDIFRLEERGRAIGWFFAACLLGPSLAPFVGGSVTHLYSWRVMQASIGVAGMVIFVFLFLFLPETSQPGERGIDKVRKQAQLSNVPVPKFTLVNPFRSMALLRSPNLLLVALITMTSLMAYFVLMTPLAYTLGVRYQLPNSSVLGVCFLPSGIGNIVGAIFVGRLSDRTVIRWKAKRNGHWYPEDRLRASLTGYAVFVPSSVLLFSLVNHYFDGGLGLVLSLSCLFFNGVGSDIAFGPCAAYLVDIMHSRSAESLAANNALRSVVVAVGTSFVLPMINNYGIVVTNGLAALLVWIAFLALLYLIRNGDALRARSTVRFSTADETG